VGLAVLIALALGEIFLRFFPPSSISFGNDEKGLMYSYDGQLGWFPTTNLVMQVTTSRTFGVTNNSQGFRDIEPVVDDKPGIMFLGDSFVWGFDVEASERFTDKLQARHPEWNIYNLGVCGYGSDQEFLLLQRLFDHYKPRVVCLIYCSDNDEKDNSWNISDGGYYKPYYVFEEGRLTLKGVPVPRSERVFYTEHRWVGGSYLMQLFVRAYYKVISPGRMGNDSVPGSVTGMILKEMRDYVQSKGAVFVIGVQGPNLQLEAYLEQIHVLYLDLTTFSPAHRYVEFGAHWTPEGHTFVSEKLHEILVKGMYAPE